MGRLPTYRRIGFYGLSRAFPQHDVRQVYQVTQQHVVLDLQEAETLRRGQLAPFHPVEHFVD